MKFGLEILMQGQQFLNAVAALLAWREENRNGVNGMLGVLFVVRKRQQAGWNHGDLGAVMESHNQFSSMSVLGDGQTVHYPDVRDPSFQKILEYVDAVFATENPLADTLTN